MVAFNLHQLVDAFSSMAVAGQELTSLTVATVAETWLSDCKLFDAWLYQLKYLICTHDIIATS